MPRIKTWSICIMMIELISLMGCSYQAQMPIFPDTTQPSMTETQQDSEMITQTDSLEERMVIPEVIGRPYENSFGSNEDAKNAWDMIVYDGRLFLGSGDYGRNSGCKIACYDLESQAWTLQKVPDEEVNDFCIIDGKLVTPGIDPQADWSMGNYYVYEDEEWNTVRTIPGGIHNFCMIEHDGLIFAGLGVLEGQTPVAVSSDGGKTFRQVPFYKDGEAWKVAYSNNDRVYNMFVLNGRVYAVAALENLVFCYEDGCFVYTAKWENKIVSASSIVMPRALFYEAVTFHDRLYLATGYLFTATDVENPTFVSIEGTHVWDLYVDNDMLYILTSRKAEKGHINSVYIMQEEEYELLFCFYDEIPAGSFAVSGSDFYFSLLYRTSVSGERSGCVLKYSME